MKTSKLGTQFFAHISRSDCEGGPETPEHADTKMAMLRGALAAGWTATPEVSVGEGLAIADVLAERGGRQVALEAQWSPITLADLTARQARYKELGIRGAWFLRNPPQRRASPAIPAFALSTSDGTPTVDVSGVVYTVESFTELLLRGRVQYRDGYSARTTTRVAVGRLRGVCARCGEPAHIDFGVELGDVLSPCGRRLRDGGWVGDDDTELSGWWQRIAKDVIQSAIRSGDVPDLPRITEHPPGKPYKSLVDGGGYCPRCGEGAVYRHRAELDQFPLGPLGVPEITAPGPHWCVDIGHGHCR